MKSLWRSSIGIFLAILSLLLSDNPVNAAEKAKQPAQPNIIVFLVDDMGVMDTSLPFLTDAAGNPKRYPLNDYYRTPGMERLAARGIRFNNFCAMSVCSPTRISIMTGQNAARHRTTNWINPDKDNGGSQGPPDWNWHGLKKGDVTLPGLLRDAGYRTIHVGKGHFAPRADEGADPANLGFDINVAGASFGSPGSYYGKDNYGALNQKRASSAVPGLEKYHGTDTFLTDALTIEAMARADDAVKDGKPFYLYFAHYAVHAPFNSDPRFAPHYKDSGKSAQAQAFATLIEGMDKSLGDVLDHLEKKGIAENTLIFFLGDNGSDAPLGDQHAVACAAPLRGKKGSHYEGGMRVPFIAAWAKVDKNNPFQKRLPIAVGAIQPQQAAIYDMFPTLLALTGQKAPKNHIVDGSRLDTLLTGKPDTSRKEQFLMHYPHSPHRTDYFTTWRDGDWKVIYHYFPTKVSDGSHYQLYNLAKDPFEQDNLADKDPAQLRRLMQGLMAAMDKHHAVYPVEKDSHKPAKPILPWTKAHKMKSILALLSALVLLHSGFAAESRPNIVIIFIDDMGYGDIGPFGATKQKTPNLDKMAREGMKLTSFYAAPVCSVSRAQLLTGCYGARVSVPGVYFPGQANGLNPKEHTIAERLKELGYTTHCVGKWHLGDQPEFLPTRQGFDHYFGIPYSNDMLKPQKSDGKRVVPLLRDEKVLELMTDEEQSRVVVRYTEEALNFIQSAKDKPFFLYFPHTAVHTPIHPGEAFAGKSANGRFGDWVEEVDWSVGRVLETLRDLKIEQNTLVLFTSDNGPWLIKGKDGGSAGPLRGGKGSTWEGGMREPTLAWWPGRIKAGSVCDAVSGTIDLLPTCVKLAGGNVPAEPVIDGRDISKLLLGQSKESPREAQYYFAGYNLQAVRQGPWKLAIASQPESMGKGTAADTKTNPRLYNLDEEIDEKTNLAEKHPDIVAKLQALASRMSAEIGGKSPTARRPAGQVENPVMLYPSDADQKTKKKAGKSKPVSLENLKPGDELDSASAPQINGKPFTITCSVETKLQDTILVAHGGLTAGYAVYLKGGHIAFLTRSGGAEIFSELVTPEKFTGSAHITAALSADGVMSLKINDQPAITISGVKLIPRQPAEDFCLGHDNAKPVAAYGKAAPFKGSITGLKITTP